MIDLITMQNAHEHGNLMSQMFQLRHRVFKEQLGWNVRSKNSEEKDEFDRPDTAYLITSDFDGKVIGAWRLLPTTKPYMASTVFKQLFAGHPPPKSSHVWECSRFVVEPPDRELTSGGIDVATASLLVGITEFAVTYDVREIVSVETPAVARLHKRARERAPVWRSPVQSIGDTRALVARYDIDGALLANLREKFKASAPIIRQLAIWEQPDAA